MFGAEISGFAGPDGFNVDGLVVEFSLLGFPTALCLAAGSLLVDRLADYHLNEMVGVPIDLFGAVGKRQLGLVIDSLLDGVGQGLLLVLGRL